MKERYTLIDGKVCRRISRPTARKLSECTDIPVYCYPVYAAPTNPFCCGILMNNTPQTKETFYSRMYEFMYYNGNRQMGYYAAFYTPIEEE
jgi:hypothetical protein